MLPDDYNDHMLDPALFARLAAGCANYLTALRQHDIPMDLAGQLVRDYHAAFLADRFVVARRESVEELGFR